MKEKEFYNNTVDGFDIEEIVRESLSLTGAPETIEISYNDMINYSKMLVTTTMESMVSKMYEMGLLKALPYSQDDSTNTDKID